MTCKEKMMEQPAEVYNYAMKYECPHDHGLNVKPDDCCDSYCKDCWEREVLELKDIVIKKRTPTAAPDYKSMYNETVCKLEEARALIKDLERKAENRKGELSYYKGVYDAVKLIFGGSK